MFGWKYGSYCSWAVQRERVNGSFYRECMCQGVCEQMKKLLDTMDAFIEFVNVLVEGNEARKGLVSRRLLDIGSREYSQRSYICI